MIGVGLAFVAVAFLAALVVPVLTATGPGWFALGVTVGLGAALVGVGATS